MSKFKSLCKKFFGTEDFYEIIGVEKSVSEQEIRKGYHKASLKVHPDRVEASEKDAATEKFKIVGHIYSILSDKEKRAVYDETGTYEDDNAAFQSDFDWMNYWQAIFKPLTRKDISDYEKQYKGSPSEALDLKKAYVNGKGCMNFILEAVPFSNCDEEPRLRKIIQKFIDEEEVPAFDEFLNEPPRKAAARRRKYDLEAKKVRLISSPLEEDETGEEALREMLMAKQRDRGEQMNSFLDKLAEKYGAKTPKKTKMIVAKKKENTQVNKRSKNETNILTIQRKKRKT